MKRIKRISMLMVVLLCTLSMMAQPQPPRGGKRFNPEEFKAQLEGEIVRRAGFTAEENHQFFAIWHEMKDKQHEISQKMFSLRRRPANSMSEKECASALLQLKKLNLQMAQVEEAYYKRLCKVVPAQKLMAAMQAEDDFHRRVLSDFNRRNDNNNRKKKPE